MGLSVKQFFTYFKLIGVVLDSYCIALWAMTQASVATVAAPRETSVLFAALLGAWLLKERFTQHRVVGTLVIVAGVLALRLSWGCLVAGGDCGRVHAFRGTY